MKRLACVALLKVCLACWSCGSDPDDSENEAGDEARPAVSEPSRATEAAPPPKAPPAPTNTAACDDTDKKWVDNRNDTITDCQKKNDGRVWQKNLDPRSFSWDAAKTYCAGLSLAGGGWRLPTVEELELLVVLLPFNPAQIIPDFFPETPKARFWTSTSYVNGFRQAWVVSFDKLDDETAVMSIASLNRVRCIR